MLPQRIARDASCAIESWPDPDLRAWQLEQLRKVIAHARAHVPLYARLWAQAAVDHNSLGSLHDLERFPIVAKEHLVKAGDSWISPRQGPVAFSTRGTSGEPLLVWLSPEEQQVYIQPTARGFRWAGFKPGMTALLMSPVWHRLAACEVHAISQLGGRSAFFWGSMGAEYIDSFLETLARIRPDFITTTAPFLLSLVRRASEKPLALQKMFRSVCSISVVGLPLTPRLREFLRDRLAVGDIFERGGTQEGAALDECAMHSAPHVHEDVCYLEVIGDDGRPVAPGTRGQLVVTKLTAAGSIFVRYKTGDIAAFLPGGCQCGCEFRRLKIYGRPESSVVVGARRVTAYDVRLCVEDDPALVGRNVLLIRERHKGAESLGVAIEGIATHEEALSRRLRDRLAVAKVDLVWLGDLRVNWGFRQVIEGTEIRPPQR
jgi:phenylacetate-coenzyme A ligase PaaK-like adenylate-forming protein